MNNYSTWSGLPIHQAKIFSGNRFKLKEVMRVTAWAFSAVLLLTGIFGDCAIGRAQTPPAAAPSVAIIKPVLSQSEDGIPLEGGQAFLPGENVFFSFQVDAYKTGSSGKVQLTGHIQAFDAKGIPISARDEQVIGTTLSQEDKEWKPKLRSQFLIPSIAPPGAYRVKFDVTDEQTKKSASAELTFPVHGVAIEPSAELVVRNLNFYRTQDDETPLRNPVYRAGDMLWVKLFITGYKYGEQNSIDVAYDVEVTGPADKSVFSQTDAAVERSQAFYPQPWVPAEFNLSLQTTMTPGPYTLIITAHDGAGHQTATARSEFRVQ
jgi:hypothetical protein